MTLEPRKPRHAPIPNEERVSKAKQLAREAGCLSKHCAVVRTNCDERYCKVVLLTRDQAGNCREVVVTVDVNTGYSRILGQTTVDESACIKHRI